MVPWRFDQRGVEAVRSVPGFLFRWNSLTHQINYAPKLESLWCEEYPQRTQPWGFSGRESGFVIY